MKCIPTCPTGGIKPENNRRLNKILSLFEKNFLTRLGRFGPPYNQTNEDKLASFKPVWINVGPPHLAKELVCLR